MRGTGMYICICVTAGPEHPVAGGRRQPKGFYHS
jgi:hypothetical protein